MKYSEKLREVYAAKRDLVDVKFALSNCVEAGFEDVCEEVLRMENALARGDYAVLRFSDLRWKE